MQLFHKKILNSGQILKLLWYFYVKKLTSYRDQKLASQFFEAHSDMILPSCSKNIWLINSLQYVSNFSRVSLVDIVYHLSFHWESIGEEFNLCILCFSYVSLVNQWETNNASLIEDAFYNDAGTFM